MSIFRQYKTINKNEDEFLSRPVQLFSHYFTKLFDPYCFHFHLFPAAGIAAVFPALGNDSLELWLRFLYIFPRFDNDCLYPLLATVPCILDDGCKLVFPRFGNGCLFFRVLATVAFFRAPWQGLLFFPRSNIVFFFSNFRLRSWLIGL